MSNNTAIDLHNRITADELEQIVRMQLKALAGNPALAKVMPPLMVWGAHWLLISVLALLTATANPVSPLL